MLSYRGYGHSEGTPNEEGMCIDSQAALDFLLQHPDINKDALVAYGQSIGGAVAIDIVARNKDKVIPIARSLRFLSLSLCLLTFTSSPWLNSQSPFLRFSSRG